MPNMQEMAKMFGGMGKMGKMGDVNDDYHKNLNNKLMNYIKEMDAEVRDRFMALKVLEDQLTDIDEEESKQIRKVEIGYEELYKDIYAQRASIVNGTGDIDPKLIQQFDARAEKLKADEGYEKVENIVCDVKSIQNIPKGVSDFWVKVMQNH